MLEHRKPVPSVIARIFVFVASLSAITGNAHAADDRGYRLEKRLPLAAGGTLGVRSEAGRVTIRGGDVAEAVVEIRSDRRDFETHFRVRFETPSADRAEVVVERKVRPPFSWFGDGVGSKAEIEITLPKSAGAAVESSGGGIEISDLDGAVTAASSGGGVRATNLGGSADLSSSGGAIRGENLRGDVDASSSGGGVHLRDAGGSVIAGSSGGSVSVTFAAGNARGGRLDSSGGGVEARIDPAVALEIDAASSGGGVSSDLPLTVRGRIDRDSLKGQLNGGGALLRLRSSGGGISIERR